MLTLRYITRLTKAFLGRFKAIIIVGVLIGFASFISLYFFLPQMISAPPERIGVSGRYTTDELPEWIVRLIGSGLTTHNENHVITPGLAESWQTPDKGKTWVFTLKNNVTWQDGTSVTVDHINYNFDDVSIEKNYPTNITFKLNSPFSPFPAVVTRSVFKKGLLGTGKWKVTDLSLAGNFVESLTLKDSDRHTKIIKFYPTEERTKLAYKLGQVDIIQDIIDPKPFLTWKTAEVIKNSNENRFIAVFFNSDDPLLSDKSLRQALYYAIDKESISDGARALGPISPLSWAYNPQIKPYDYDVKRAKELIAASMKDKKNINLEVKLVTNQVLLSKAEKIAKNWEEIGVKTQVQVTPLVPSEFQAFLGIYDIPIDPDQYVTWHSTQKESNITHYNNPRIDKLLEDGRLEIDQEKRKKIYLDFQRFLAEDAPAAFLYHPAYYTVKRK